MPGLSGLSNQSCERRFLPRGARIFGFLVMTILGRFWASAARMRRTARKAQGGYKKAEIVPKHRVCLAGISTRICDRNFLRSVVLHPSGDLCLRAPLRAPTIERAT